MAGLKQLNWASEGVGATAAALVDLSTVAGNKISNPPWVKFQSAGWVNFPSAPTGTIILRVWQDRKIKHDGAHYMQLSHLQKYGEGQDNLGYMERLEHIKLIQNGAKCYMVMCLAKDSASSPREIQSFNKNNLFLGGKLCEIDSDWFIEIAASIPVQSAT